MPTFVPASSSLAPMRPSPPLDAFPSSPSSAWSSTGSRSANQDYLSPPTPDSYFFPTPAIVSPDEFTVQLDVQLDKIVGSPREYSIAHSLPQSPVPSPKMDPCYLSGDDMRKVQVFLRNRGRWENMYDRFESSPPLRPRNAPPVLPLSQNSASDDFSWDALVDPTELADPSRCSLLIHEVSLLVGLTADDDHLSPDDGCPLVPDASKQVHDILPLTLTPTKSLASRKHRDASLPHTNARVHSSHHPISPSIADNADPFLHNEVPPPIGSRNLAMPIPRHKSSDATRLTPSPLRRQGQVFHFDPPLSNAPHQNPVDLDETFFHPRKPPPKPTPNSPANRCSSLDRLESSLLKLEAHAPRNHRKSQSEGRSSDRVVQRNDNRPSLLHPRHLRQQHSIHEIMHRNPSRPAHGSHFSGPPPVPRPILSQQYVAPQICTSVPSNEDHLGEDRTPGSFMDMDIPRAEEAGQKRRISFRQMKSKEKMKSLVSAAKRVIAWGKNLAGSTNPPVTAQEMTTVQSARV
ncbi:hypothetical protein OG21DRAFT_1495583 [Imleria badia]|nr:hypothetical protein OG21DRAFT_1495583 [Imleria badia]